MSFTSFNFNKHIADGLKSQGYVAPTPIQEQAIGPILEGRDLLGLAQTGTGKTAAFTLPILQQLSGKESGKSPRALIISPTRELAEQTATYIGNFSKRLKLRCSVIYGGVSRTAQIRQLQKGADIIVACPGRLLDLANDGEVSLAGINILVLDEADQMFDKGFLPDIKRIIAKLPATRQNLVFSATMPGEVRSLVEGLLENPVEAAVNHTRPVTNISHSFYHTTQSGKSSLLKSILKTEKVDTAIVFTRTKHKAKRLAQQLHNKGFKATSLQGNLSQQQRQNALEGFKRGTYNILVATDIAARGIDVAGISHVINFDMPGTTEAYTHRTGRTGRANRTGEAFTFATADDYKMTKSLERALKEKLVHKNTPVAEVQDVVSHDRTAPKKAAPKPARPHRKTRGKRSSQRNRAAAFDFGL
jgi:superfamily II DNA/RNA helicase